MCIFAALYSCDKNVILSYLSGCSLAQFLAKFDYMFIVGADLTPSFELAVFLNQYFAEDSYSI